MPRARNYKTLFIGDLNGQYRLWHNVLAPLANRVDEVVQLGNVIGCDENAKDHEDRGPNNAILHLIFQVYGITHGNWTQIVGPNEIAALNLPDEWTNVNSNRILRKFWLPNNTGEPPTYGFKVAAVSKTRLVTHGGLTYGEWLELGKPRDAVTAAKLLNEKYCGLLYMGESYLLTGTPSIAANPVFADPLRETYTSWCLAPEPPPFGQVHAQNSLNSEDGHRFIASEVSPLLHVEAVRHERFGGIVNIKGKDFYSVHIDVDHTKRYKKFPPPWEPYIESTPVIDLSEPMEDIERLLKKKQQS